MSKAEITDFGVARIVLCDVFFAFIFLAYVEPNVFFHFQAESFSSAAPTDAAATATAAAIAALPLPLRCHSPQPSLPMPLPLTPLCCAPMQPRLRCRCRLCLPPSAAAAFDCCVSKPKLQAYFRQRCHRRCCGRCYRYLPQRLSYMWLEEWGEQACRPYHGWVHRRVSTLPSSGGN